MNDSIEILGRIYQRQQNLAMLADARKKLQRREVRWRRLLVATLALLVLLMVVRFGQTPQTPHHLSEDQIKLNQLFDSIR